MSRFAEIADRCQDENFKKIYQIASGRIDLQEGVSDSHRKPVSFTNSEVEEIKDLQYETVKANYVADGGFKTVDDLKKEVTILIVTHNMGQAKRISERSMFMYLGELVEYGDTSDMFSNPKDERTKAYLTGKMG